jgi:hypothetical protein
MITPFILWVSGVLCTISVGGFVYYRNKSISLSGQLKLATNQLTELVNEKKEKESTKRLARFTTKGWHNTKDKDDPNKKTWNVIFELREIAVSLDETKSKFEIISITSEEMGSKLVQWGDKEYTEWFEKKTGGGWLSADNKELEWITTMSKSEQRDLKLKTLGI